MNNEKTKVFESVIKSRMALKKRFEKQIEETPALSDDQPQGSGPTNRHGMPQLPVGQHETENWPVLDLGIHPEIQKNEWRLQIDGACQNPLTLNWREFQALKQVEDISDFHCVTTWSKLNISWKGVRFSNLAELVIPMENATHIICHAYDDYTTNLPLVEALKSDVLLVFEANGSTLSKEHGGPLRMITPQLYAWKGAKWIKRIEFLNEDKKGFWEERGYSNSAHPWRNDRYS